MRRGVGTRFMLMFMRVSMRMRMLVNVFVLVMKRMRVVLSWALRLSFHQHVNLRRANATTVHACDLQHRTDVQGLNRFLKKFDWNSCVDKRAEKHVAADPGEAVEISDAARSAVRRPCVVRRTVVGRRLSIVGSSLVVRRASHIVRQNAIVYRSLFVVRQVVAFKIREYEF